MGRARFFVLLSVILELPSVLAQTPHRSCYSSLNAADANDDNILTQDEYAESIRLMTRGVVNAPFDSLNAQLQTSFSSRVAAGSAGVNIVTDGSDAVTEVFCVETFEGIVTQLEVAITQQQCFIAMSVGDSGSQTRGILASDPDFARYANQMSLRVDPAIAYGFTTPFSALPEPVQTVFNDFSNGDGVSISGSTIGSTPSPQEQVFLSNLCAQTTVAIVVGEEASGVGPAPTLAPVEVPATTAAPVEAPAEACFDFDFDYCEGKMLPSDLNRDNLFVQVEYIRFLNFITNDTYANLGFDALPTPLQENWLALATETTPSGPQIPIFGSKPFETPTAEQQASLENVCNSTKIALFPACGGGGTSPDVNPPVMAPGGTTTMAPVAIPQVDYLTCTRSMLTSDINPRDSALQPNVEYVSFINKIANNIYLGVNFDDLPEVVQDAFDFLASDGSIDITGALPGQSPSPERVIELEEICSVTLAATVGIPPSTEPSEPTAAPVPTAAPSPAQPQSITIYNAFYLSNTDDIVAASLLSGQNRDGIDQGYAAFIQNVFAAYLAENPRGRRHLRSRWLEILGLDDESISVYEIVDTDCPESITEENASCQIAYGQWQINTIRESDPVALQAELTTVSQENISGETNGLNSYVLAANPDTQVTVVGPSNELRPETQPPSQAPPPLMPDSGDDGPNVGTIVGSIIGIVVVVVGGGFLYQHKRNGGSFLPSLPSRAKTNKIDDEKMDAGTGSGSQGGIGDLGGGAYGGQFQSDIQSDEKDSSAGNGLFSSFGVETSDSQDTEEKSGGFSIQEQSPSKRAGHRDDNTEPSEEGADNAKSSTFGAFGFGGKKKSSAVSENPVNDLDDSQSNNDDDFNNYEYDQTNDDSVKDMFNGDEDWNPQGQSSGAWGGDARAWGADGGSPGGMFSNDETISKSQGSGDCSDDSRSSSDDHSESSEDDTYDEGTLQSSVPSRQSTDEDMQEVDDMVDQGDWDGVVGEPRDDKSESSGSDCSRSSEDSENYGEDSTEPSVSTDTRNLNPRERELREKYRLQVEALVAQVVPSEMDNITAMMDQFMGREAELLKTLEAMYDRSSNQRARRAVHKSRGVRQQSGRFSAGGLDGSAAIAAASTIGGGSYIDDDGTYDDEDHGEQYSDDDHSGSGSYSDGERSYDDNDDYSRSEGSHSGSHDDEEGSYRSGSGSYSDRSDDRSGSYSDRSGSYSDADRSRSHSGSRSYDENDDSNGSGTGSGSGSYDD